MQLTTRQFQSHPQRPPIPIRELFVTAHPTDNEVQKGHPYFFLDGAEVLITREGDTLLHEAYGWKDREAGVPLEINSVFSLASLTKPVTALAALILVAEGMLSLDDQVRCHIPDFRAEPRAKVRDLLAQTSGDGGEHGDGGYNIYEAPSLSAWVAEWADNEASATYGQFSYSNFNYAALGHIVERVSGVNLGDFVTRRILQPLGMNDTFVSFSPDYSWADRVPASYVWNSKSNGYDVFWTPDRPQRWRPWAKWLPLKFAPQESGVASIATLLI